MEGKLPYFSTFLSFFSMPSQTTPAMQTAAARFVQLLSVPAAPKVVCLLIPDCTTNRGLNIKLCW